MKPFNLEKALSGESIVTREGNKVELFQVINNDDYPVVGIITYSDGTQAIESWTKDGQFAISDKESEFDLVMAPKKIVTIDITAEKQITNYAFSKDVTEILIYHNVLEEDALVLKSTLSCAGYTITKEEIYLLEE